MRNRQKGFTLIELLIVVAVLGALAGIAIPKFIQYRARAEVASLLADARSIYRGFILYYIENPDGVGGFPYFGSAPKFDNTTFFPLTNRSDPFDYIDFNLDSFKRKVKNGQADAYGSPDDPIPNDEFYLLLTMSNDPNTRIVIAQTDEIDVNGGDGGGGNLPGVGNTWVDGVFIYRDGALIY